MSNNNNSNYEGLLPPHWKREVEGWIKDDCPSFDIGGLVVGDKYEEAELYCKSNCVLAGVPFFNAVFEYLGCRISWKYQEGTLIENTSNEKVLVATVSGSARNILLGERTALNILSRASGVATAADEAVQSARNHGWQGHVAGTRKTTPGFRIVEKYSLLVGGASTHRLDLSNMVMLKDNHIWSAGNITNAIKIAKNAAGFSSKIEVECRTLEEAHEAALSGADIVMLDNFEPGQLKMASALLKASHPHVILEASGGITSSNMHKYLTPHIDVVSRGNLTQGYACMDFSLKIKQSSTLSSSVVRSEYEQGNSNGSNNSNSTINQTSQLATNNHFSSNNIQTDDHSQLIDFSHTQMSSSNITQGKTSSVKSAAKKVRKKKGKTPIGNRVAVPGAYRCIRGPTPFYLSMNLGNPDPILEPLKVGDIVKNCLECTASNGGMCASWLQLSPQNVMDGNVRFLPAFMHGEAMFEPLLVVIPNTSSKKPYDIPEMQKFYTVFSSLIRQEVKDSMPDAIRGDINREIGRRWRELSEEQKCQYTIDRLPPSSPHSLKRSHQNEQDQSSEELQVHSHLSSSSSSSPSLKRSHVEESQAAPGLASFEDNYNSGANNPNEQVAHGGMSHPNINAPVVEM